MTARAWPCQHCNVSFSNPVARAHHVKRHHRDSRPDRVFPPKERTHPPLKRETDAWPGRP